ncbi:Sec-independent protein translocase subunit TatA/TatB [Mariniblastus fucicola]|uniref:Sec-independent protein translocase protein TatA n=1 Tax=Mariniblastus fucicola TaxID=980251 RepID=A0A5B9PCI6_9BACT|nr:twin-arginine translocase TatA/TatE family subunit [Mariniblastus fucicola]QEG23209.1 twin arginine translocase protein A [Mariniblastus fucicola]
MFGLGWAEVALIAGIFVLLFGGAKLPSLMRNMGRSVNEFKAGMAQKPKSLEEDSEEESTSDSKSKVEEKETADV